jgi:hypothetical protein
VVLAPLQFTRWVPDFTTYDEPIPVAVPVNLLPNPGFDTDLHGWTIYGGGISWDIPGRTAPGSCRMDGDGVYNRDLLGPTTEVEPGDVLTAAVWVGFAAFNSHGQTPLHLAGVTALAGTTVDFPVIQAVAPDGDSAQLYQLKGQFTVPAGVDSFALRLSMRDVATGTVWWDDAELYKA